MKATQEPVKLPINAMKSAKCGMEIAGKSMMRLVSTRTPINQTRSGSLQGNDSLEIVSSIICSIDRTMNGYENITFTIKTAFIRMCITPVGRLLTITSWIFELNDKKAQTEKTILKIITKMKENANIA